MRHIRLNLAELGLPFLAVVFAAGLAALAAFTFLAGGENTDLAARGRQVFISAGCSSCHTVTSRGQAASARRPIGTPPDLAAVPHRSADWYLAYFLQPQAILPYSPMPSYGNLNDGELKALIAYLQSLYGEAPTPRAISAEEIPQVPPALSAYRTGRRLYQLYCQGCHGVEGNGNGPVGHVLSPEPRDFSDGAWMSKQTDLYLFSVITQGKANTAMSSYESVLTAEERALLLRYIRYFADPVTRQRLEQGLPLR